MKSFYLTILQTKSILHLKNIIKKKIKQFLSRYIRLTGHLTHEQILMDSKLTIPLFTGAKSQAKEAQPIKKLENAPPFKSQPFTLRR